MVRHNRIRRQALLDASIEVLAAKGARGLTFRAVDEQARVPRGTASNYFANRDELLAQIACGHVLDSRSSYLAFLELRLEATRRPGLQALITERVRAELDTTVPDDANAVITYLVVNGLILDNLTLPGIFTDDQIEELIRSIAPPPARHCGQVARDRPFPMGRL
ncbi:TetR family transcriptional regulator [Nocardia sp. NPDC052001]|uniref:TetR/AcrR family transcriptional regulator n=1 Tax=Nocardia sp. NPDC052001 TaxID=3154853 RepID=UPI0034251CCD